MLVPHKLDLLRLQSSLPRGLGVYVPATEECQEVRIAVPIDGEEDQSNNTA